MADLPSFVGTEQVQPGPIIQAPDIYSGYQKMIGEIQSVTKPMAQSVMDQQARIKAQEDGQQLGFRSGVSIGEASKIYNQTALLTNKYTAGTDILNKVGQFESEAQSDVGQGDDAVGNFRNKIKAYSTGLLQTIPNENRAYVSNLLMNKATRSELKIQAAQTKRDQEIATAQLKQTTFTYHNEASNSAAEGDEKTALHYYTQLQSMYDGFRDLGHIKPSEYVALTDVNTQKMYESQLIANLNKTLSSHQNGAKLSETLKAANGMISSFGQSKQVKKLFSADAISSMQKKGENIVQKYLQGTALDKKHLSQTEQGQLQGALSGHTPDPETIAEIREANPQDFPAFKSQIEKYQNAGQEIQQVKDADIATGNALIAAHESDSSRINWNDPNSLVDQQVASAKLKAMHAIQNQKIEDFPAFIKTTKGFQALEARIPDYPESFKKKLIYQYIYDKSIQAGFSPSHVKMLSKEYATGFVGQAHISSIAQQTQMARQVKSEYENPFFTTLAFNQLSRMGLPQSMRTISSIEDNPDTASESINVQSALQKTPKEWQSDLGADATTQKNVMSQIKTAVNQESAKTFNMFSNNPLFLEKQSSQFQNLKNQAISLSAYYVHLKNMDPEAAAKKAVHVIIGSHYSEGSFNGDSFAIPRTDGAGNVLDPLDVKAATKIDFSRIVKDPDLAVDPEEVRDQAPENKRSAYISRVENGAYLQNTSMGLQWTYNGKPLMRQPKPTKLDPHPRSVPYLLTWRDFGDPTSNLNINLHSAIDKVRKEKPLPRTPLMGATGVVQMTGLPISDTGIKNMIIDRTLPGQDSESAREFLYGGRTLAQVIMETNPLTRALIKEFPMFRKKGEKLPELP